MSKGNIIITGVSTGIGLYCTKKFIQEGYTVYGSLRKSSDAERIQNELGASFYPLIFDVTDAQAIAIAKDELDNKIGNQGIKLLINNAGIVVAGPLELLDTEEYRRQFEVNVFGLLEVTKAFLPLLGAKENCTFPAGRIINISSVASKQTMPFLTPYSASKAAVDRISEGLRRELMIYGIDVITINPGPVKTPIWNKAEKPSEEVLASPYGPMFTRFYQLVVKEVKAAMPVEDLADIVFKKFVAKRPKTNEVVMNNKLTKYILPKILLTHRTIDKFVKKTLRI